MGQRRKRSARLRAATTRLTAALDRYAEAVQSRTGRKRALRRLESAMQAFDEAHERATGDEAPVYFFVNPPVVKLAEPYEPDDAPLQVAIISRVDLRIVSERRLAQAAAAIDPGVTHLGHALYALDHADALGPELAEPVAGAAGYFACDRVLTTPGEGDIEDAFVPPGELLYSTEDVYVG